MITGYSNRVDSIFPFLINLKVLFLQFSAIDNKEIINFFQSLLSQLTVEEVHLKSLTLRHTSSYKFINLLTNFQKTLTSLIIDVWEIPTKTLNFSEKFWENFTS